MLELITGVLCVFLQGTFNMLHAHLYAIQFRNLFSDYVMHFNLSLEIYQWLCHALQLVMELDSSSWVNLVHAHYWVADHENVIFQFVLGLDSNTMLRHDTLTYTDMREIRSVGSLLKDYKLWRTKKLSAQKIVLDFEKNIIA